MQYVHEFNRKVSSWCFLFVEVSSPYKYTGTWFCALFPQDIIHTWFLLSGSLISCLSMKEKKDTCIFPLSLWYFFSNFVNECRVMDIGLILWHWALSMSYVLVHLITLEKNLHHLRKWRRYLIIQLPFEPYPFVQWIS